MVLRRLGPRCEPAASQQLAFQCGEKALAHGVVVGISDRSQGWTCAGFPAAAAERQRCVLGALVAAVDDICWVCAAAAGVTDNMVPGPTGPE